MNVRELFTVLPIFNIIHIWIIVSGALHVSLCVTHTFCKVSLFGTLLMVYYDMINLSCTLLSSEIGLYMLKAIESLYNISRQCE